MDSDIVNQHPSEFAARPHDLRRYAADMLEGLSDLAARSGDAELQSLLALTTKAVQTITRSS